MLVLSKKKDRLASLGHIGFQPDILFFRDYWGVGNMLSGAWMSVLSKEKRQARFARTYRLSAGHIWNRDKEHCAVKKLRTG